jgi:hypothetical protein
VVARLGGDQPRGPPAGGEWAVDIAARSSRTIRKFLLLAVLVLVLGGVIFVLTWDIPAPTRQIEVVVPDERLPR